MKKANALGNNDAFYNNTWTDPYTMAAKSRYGQTYSYWSPVNPTITVESDMEGSFPVVLPLITSAQAPLQNQASPWEWWDPNHPLATAVVSAGPPPVTAHMANSLSNPDMSVQKGLTYLDTIQGYIMPRICEVLKANGVNIGINENEVLTAATTLFPNPATNSFRISSEIIEEADVVDIMNINGQVVKTLTEVEMNERIDVSNLSDGVYFVTIHTSNGVATKKLIIQ